MKNSTRQKQVIFDDGPLSGSTAFIEPSHIIRADHPEDVSAAFEAMEDAKAQGYWLAGYLSYELGYVLEPKLHDYMPPERTTPLIHFGAFDAPTPTEAVKSLGPTSLTKPEPLWDADEYNEAFYKIIDHLKAGDIYQANLTFPLKAHYTGTPIALYNALLAKQSVPHGAFVDLGGPALLSRSPELFFEVDKTGQMQAKPMKGTAARGQTPEEDAAQIEWLQNSEKNQAENVMIVDLLRNDMSRLAEVGSVKVPNLFTVETYATLHQMTSRITAQLLPHASLHDIFSALFPCGSITGAPKIRAMQILRSLENNARDAYCGAIGWIAPNGEMKFNVAIRTLICHDDGTARLNVGGGIVFDSTAEAEFAEALIKSQFAVLNERGDIHSNSSAMHALT